jgi:hypothetical protein
MSATSQAEKRNRRASLPFVGVFVLCFAVWLAFSITTVAQDRRFPVKLAPEREIEDEAVKERLRDAAAIRPRMETARPWEVLEAADKFGTPFIAWVDCSPEDAPELRALFMALGGVVHARVSDRDQPNITGANTGPRLVWHNPAGERFYYPVSAIRRNADHTAPAAILKSLGAGADARSDITKPFSAKLIPNPKGLNLSR